MYEFNCQTYDLSHKKRLSVPLPANLLNNTDFDAVFIRGITASADINNNDVESKSMESIENDYDSDFRIGPRSFHNDKSSFMCTKISSNTQRNWVFNLQLI
jgi:hypothetical protein